MTTFESNIEKSIRSADYIYNLLIDFIEMEKVLPSDKMKNWKAEAESCSFTVDGLGDVGLKIVDKELFNKVKYVGFGKVPFNFYLSVLLNGNSSNGTEVQVVVDAKLNPLIKMVASSQIKKFIQMLGEAIAQH